MSQVRVLLPAQNKEEDMPALTIGRIIAVVVLILAILVGLGALSLNPAWLVAALAVAVLVG